ncbi:MAG: hypothetical protein JJU29_14465 [Verrucomicrobia bacterium]|nr:hypothetical protein [Verrucomicrobiota bacterium]MCH8513306.1 hypothetical protein [Kiritimatiellia bacterium]
MSDPTPTFRDVSRITCMVHQRLGAKVTECLVGMGAHTVLVENARAVRQHIRPRPWMFPGNLTEIHGTPVEVFRTTVPRDCVDAVMRALIEALELERPGHGAIYAQDLKEHSLLEPPVLKINSGKEGLLLRDLVLLTGILSQVGGGDALAKSALKLGTCVPVITRGMGTGIRDQLGLLRITIPPEKELVHLMLPAQDAAGIQRLLIEDARMDRPGGGFLYQTPIRAGVVDPLLRIGRQEHAASMEQVIAAMDELKCGTGWRKRFGDLEDPRNERMKPLRRNHREITFICTEGRVDAFVRAAMRVGAGGATTARVRCLSESDFEGGIGARERGILCVPAGRCDTVIEALYAAEQELEDTHCRIQMLEAPSVFSHQR